VVTLADGAGTGKLVDRAQGLRTVKLAGRAQGLRTVKLAGRTQGLRTVKLVDRARGPVRERTVKLVDRSRGRLGGPARAAGRGQSTRSLRAATTPRATRMASRKSFFMLAG
jgi:hypothetical protein